MCAASHLHIFVAGSQILMPGQCASERQPGTQIPCALQILPAPLPPGLQVPSEAQYTVPPLLDPLVPEVPLLPLDPEVPLEPLDPEVPLLVPTGWGTHFFVVALHTCPIGQSYSV